MSRSGGRSGSVEIYADNRRHRLEVSILGQEDGSAAVGDRSDHAIDQTESSC